MTPRAKAVGQRGSRFAEIGGVQYACVHEHWFKQATYHDPELRVGDARSDALVRSLRENKAAILTRDVVSRPEDDGLLSFKRKAYIALWSIDDIVFDDEGLRFRFTARLAEL